MSWRNIKARMSSKKKKKKTSFVLEFRVLDSRLGKFWFRMEGKVRRVFLFYPFFPAEKQQLRFELADWNGAV